MPLSVWLTFAAASLILSVAPGPDNIFVLTQSTMFGRKAGVAVVMGLCTGLVFQTAAAALGVAAVVAANPALLWAIKLAGAAYLVYLAVMAWTHPTVGSGKGGVKLPMAALWRRGVIMNLTNPKVQIFFLTFFPQFLAKGMEGTAVAIQMVIQGITFIGATLVVFLAVAWCAGTIGDRMKDPAVQTWISRTGAVIFVCLAAATLLLD